MPVITESSEEQGASGQDGSEVQPDTSININTPETAPKIETTMGAIRQAFAGSSNVSVSNMSMEQPGPSSQPTYAELNNLSMSSFSLNSLTSNLSNPLQIENFERHNNSNLSSASSSMSELYNSVNNLYNNSEAYRSALNLPMGDNSGRCVSSSDSETDPYAAFVREKNKTNVFKTLEGQADIISNWSLKANDPRKIWILMGGNPYEKAKKMHNGNSGSNRTGVGLGVARGLTPMGSSAETSASTSVTDEFDPINISNVMSGIDSADEGSGDDSSDEDNESQSFGEHSVPPEAKKINRVFPCSRCFPTTYYISKYYWCKHVINEHGREFQKMNEKKLFNCSTCSKMFGQKRSRDDHAKTHALSTPGVE